MKRPLAWFCLAFSILLAAFQLAGQSGTDSPPLLALKKINTWASSSEQLAVSGCVKECSALSDGTKVYIDHITIQKKDNSSLSLLSDLKLIFTENRESLAPGDFVVVEGTFKPFTKASNPGQFDARGWYFSQNTVGSIEKPQLLEKRKGSASIKRSLHFLRKAFRESYGSILGDKAARILSAISLGEKGLMEQEWKELYQEGGIAHILAISGLHISMIGMALYQMLRKTGKSFVISALISGNVIFLYALMTGAGVSTLRAAIMFGLYLGSQICGRKYDMTTAAAVSAFLLVAPDAGHLTEASFLLSFSAILSAGILLPCLEKNLDAEAHPWMDHGVVKGLLYNAVLLIGTLPWTLYFYYQMTPWSILVNLVVVPLLSSLLGWGFLAGFAGLFWQPAGIFLAAPVHYLLYFFDWLCTLEQKMPGAVLVLGRPALWQIGGYYLILAAVIRLSLYFAQKKEGRNLKKIIRRFLWLPGCLAAVLLLCMRDHSRLRITCLDVGQGDCALVQLPGGDTCLIDGGSSSKRNIWDNIIEPAVKYYGIRSIRYVFLSHADTDHISGLEEYFESYSPGAGGVNIHGVSAENLVLPPTAEKGDFSELKKQAEELGVAVWELEKGGSIRSSGESGWRIECMAPGVSALTGDKNEDSMVLKLQYRHFSMLFTGDLEKAAEERLAAEITECDALKVGHHGSKNASSELFLSKVRPKVSVISCGAGNIYGHPAKETLERLQEAGSRIFRTPEDGAVQISSGGKEVTVDVFCR